MSVSTNWEAEVKSLIRAAEDEESSMEAIRLYSEALNHLPPHASQSVYATQLLASIGEQYYLSGCFDKAFSYFSRAVASEGGLGLSAIHFRLGQLRLERGELERARDELMRVYMGSGKLIFDFEDPKYFELIREIVEKPHGGAPSEETSPGETHHPGS